jgi:predicted nucleotidyltransferase
MTSFIHTKAELLNLLFSNKESIRSFGVKELGLFGSFALNKDIRIDSDVDFLIEFYPEKKITTISLDLLFF